MFPMNNYKMTVQYDGTRYSGWQRQGNTASTIQGKLERALSRLLGEDIQVSGAGRTDGGVHAMGQCANFKSVHSLNCEDFQKKLNEALPEDIAVLDLHPASPRFHARLSAKEKTYRYTIRNTHTKDVFSRKYVYQVPEPLDLAAMETAKTYLLGTHDFKGFSTGRTKKSTVRHLSSIEIEKEGETVTLIFTGNGFLYNMVRILSGTLIETGLSQREPESVLSVLESGDRQEAGFTAPAQGLCLMNVMY